MEFYIYLLVISVLYFLLIIFFIKGWKKLPDFTPGETNKNILSVSVIVPCHNEEKNLLSLFEALSVQTYQDFELLLINDHSTDATESIIKNHLPIFKNAVYFSSKEKGKKKALQEAIELAKGELIITTDADCTPSNKWIETIIDFYSQQNCDLIIGPVKMKNDSSFFQRLQTLEFVSLIATGATTAASGKPILCNGANLAFLKKSFLESKNDLHDEELSGDDIFLLQSIKKRQGKIQFLKSTEAFTETQACKTIAEFFKQRKRWASKSKTYQDKFTVFIALLVFLMCFNILVLLIVSIMQPIFWKIFITIFIFKYLLDASFLATVSKFFSIKNMWRNAFFLSLFYPFYVVLVTIAGIVFKQKKW